MKVFHFPLIFPLLLAGCNYGNENKKAAAVQNQKPLPVYKLAFSNDFEDYSFRFFVDTIHNSIEIATDSVDVMYRDFETSSHFDDSIELNRIMNARYENFTHYYINNYFLSKDTFTLSTQAIADTYHLPLIFEILTGYSRCYTSPKSFETFPVDGIGDSTEKLPEYHFNPMQLAEADFQTHDTVRKILDDKLIDLNYDSIPERILVYNSKEGNTVFVIFEKRNNNWVESQKKIYFNADYAGVSSLQLAGMKNRSVLLKIYQCSYVPRKRYFEMVLLFVPEE